MNPILTIQELFFQYPSKQWHFEDVLCACGLSRGQVNFWLRKLRKEQIIVRIKPKGKMPYYIANYKHVHYQNTKRLFGFAKLHESGLLDYLCSLDKANTVILFGSFARWDWHNDSDIDLFIYGDVEDVDLGKFYGKLHREIQVFSGKNEKDLYRYGSGLLRSILKGITIKGSIPLEMITHAAV